MRPIDADNLLWCYEKRMDSIKWIRHRDRTYLKAIRDCIKDLESRPTVEAEQTIGKWVPLRTRPMDEDERKEWSKKLGYKLEDDEAVIYGPPLPDDGEDVIICLRSGRIRVDTF